SGRIFASCRRQTIKCKSLREPESYIAWYIGTLRKINYSPIQRCAFDVNLQGQALKSIKGSKYCDIYHISDKPFLQPTKCNKIKLCDIYQRHISFLVVGNLHERIKGRNENAASMR